MRLALIIVFASSTVLADDGAAPVMPVTPVATAWSVHRITPAEAKVKSARMDTAKLAKANVASAPLAAPAQFAVVLGTSTAKLVQAKVELFLADIDSWRKVSDFMKPPAGPKKLTGGNWLDAARDALRTKIDRDGYTPEALSEAAALMRKARQGK